MVSGLVSGPLDGEAPVLQEVLPVQQGRRQIESHVQALGRTAPHQVHAQSLIQVFLTVELFFNKELISQNWKIPFFLILFLKALTANKCFEDKILRILKKKHLGIFHHHINIYYSTLSCDQLLLRNTSY